MLTIEMRRENETFYKDFGDGDQHEAAISAALWLNLDPLTTRVILHLEDTSVSLPPSSEYPRVVHAFDCFTGTYHCTQLSAAEVQALLILGIAGDDTPTAADHYAILESILETWPTECRPVP